MDPLRLSRRRFALLSALAATDHAYRLRAQPMGGAAPKSSAADLTRQIVDKTGVPTPDNSVDGFKAGDESTPIRGVAVAAMATVDVLRQAAKANLNLVLTFEPTFFGRNDGQPPAADAPPWGRGGVAQNDPILTAKRQLIQSSGLVVYRFHDHWVNRKENDLAAALGSALGWSRFAKNSDPTSYEIAPQELSELVPKVKAQLKVNGGMRVVGDPAAKIRRVVLLPGIQPLSSFTSRMPEADLVITGETRDWEGEEYAADTVAAGEKKGLISVGRVVSEDPGMRACADWIRTFIHDVPVQWIPTGDPFWRPA